jgi:AbrB family looped-hinge helix DNA binding protein
MAIATVTSKGQITIPAKVRDRLGINAGDQVEFLDAEHGQVTLLVRNQSVKRLKGILGKFDRTLSIEELNEGIAERASRAGRLVPNDER